jgi:hypothetical protein
MALKQAISSVSQSGTVLVANPCYYLSNAGATFSAMLEVNINGDWLPALAAAVTASMTNVVFTGRFTETEDAVPWRWNVTAISVGTVTVYIG